MGDADEAALIDALRRRDDAGFRELAERHRREIRLHCYRLMGSIDDADDQVQETFLRAWRHIDSFEGRSTVRAWLYKIATNACFDALARRAARTLPQFGQPASDPGAPLPDAVTEPIWI